MTNFHSLSLLPTNYQDILKLAKSANKDAGDIGYESEFAVKTLHKSADRKISYYGIADGSGQSAGMFFDKENQTVLFNIFDHEDLMNMYPLDSVSEFNKELGQAYPDMTVYDLQRMVYQGMPPKYFEMFENQEESYFWLNIEKGNQTILYSSGMFMFNDGVWKPIEGYENLVTIATDYKPDFALEYAIGLFLQNDED